MPKPNCQKCSKAEATHKFSLPDGKVWEVCVKCSMCQNCQKETVSVVNEKKIWLCKNCHQEQQEEDIPQQNNDECRICKEELKMNKGEAEGHLNFLKGILTSLEDWEVKAKKKWQKEVDNAQAGVNEFERKINQKITCNLPNRHGYESRSNPSYSSPRVGGGEERYCKKCKEQYIIIKNSEGDVEPDKHANCSQDTDRNNPNSRGERERERERERDESNNYGAELPN